MKSLLIVGNWKSNKTTAEALRWLQDFKVRMDGVPTSSATIVLCAPFTLLYTLKEALGATSLPVVLGAQNVSPFAEGAETGEESARMVRELAEWVIIGHSERRTNFGETDEILAKKVQQAREAGLHVIYCVPDKNAPVPASVDAVAYEPIFAIGSGSSDSPAHADEVAQNIKARSQVPKILYGGSVTAANVGSFISRPSIDGVLPGKASLAPEQFADLIRAAIAANI